MASRQDHSDRQMVDNYSAQQQYGDHAPDLDSSESQQHFQSIVAEAGEGVVIVRSSHVIAYANSAAMYLLAQGRPTLVGEIFGLPITANDDRVDVNVIAEDGSLRQVEMHVEPLDGEGGTTVLRLRDVTGYQRRVAFAQNEVRRRDEFLAMLSHELRNPLAAIRSATSLLDITGLDDSSRAEAHGIIDRQFKHLSRILDDLLDVTRVLRGKLTLNCSRVNLNQILLDAVEAIQPLMDGRRQSFELNLPDHDVWLWADETRLEQLVVNLLHNAAKFAPENGSVGLSASISKSHVTICVRDDGPGVPDELKATLFDAFVQGKQSLDRSDGGLGIGLMLVRTFAELHGGSVEVRRNQNGRGACFLVTLPLLEVTPRPDAARQEDPPHGRLRILLVEDMADVRKMLRLLLQADGFEVLEAASGPEAVSLLLDEPLDIALIDIGLPGMNGYEVAAQVRRSKASPLPWLVAVTGYGRSEDVEAAREAGFDYHLVKPLQVSVLRKLLDQLTRDRTEESRDASLAGLQSTQ